MSGDGRVRYDLNKKQWYTVRDKLTKRGLWKYTQEGTKKRKTAETSKRSAEDDPLEGTSKQYRQTCKYPQMDQCAAFVLTGNCSCDTPDETKEFLTHASIIIRGRWSATTSLQTATYIPKGHETQKILHVLIVNFDRYNIGTQRFIQGLGDLACLLNIQRVPPGMSPEEACTLVQLQEMYNIPNTLESEPDTAEHGSKPKQKRFLK